MINHMMNTIPAWTYQEKEKISPGKQLKPWHEASVRWLY